MKQAWRVMKNSYRVTVEGGGGRRKREGRREG